LATRVAVPVRLAVIDGSWATAGGDKAALASAVPSATTSRIRIERFS
jgi:hypothetical protein